jgi:hypothetical protein
MIKQNYAFEKRQKEIAKKQKKQEKLQQKTAVQGERTEHEQPAPADDKTSLPEQAGSGSGTES